jgi:hypothetical protein
MNARFAVDSNEVMTNELLTYAKEMATRLNISISEAIDKKVAFYVKYAKTSTEIAAWEIRGENAKKLK